MYDAQSQFLMFYVLLICRELQAAGRVESSSGRDVTAIYQSHFSRKRVVLAFPLKSQDAEDSRESSGRKRAAGAEGEERSGKRCTVLRRR